MVALRALSANLGQSIANQLQQLVRGKHGVHYFGDDRQLTHYDLVARSAFVRVILVITRRVDPTCRAK